MADIKKVRFKVTENGPCFIEDMHKCVYEIFESGKIVKYSYLGRNRRFVNKEENVAQRDIVEKLFLGLDDLVRANWKEEVVCEICDGCSYELQITYANGQREKHVGDVGGGTIDGVVTNFLQEFFDVEEW